MAGARCELGRRAQYRAKLGGSAALSGVVAALVVGGVAGASTHARRASSKAVPLVVYSAQGYDKAETQAFEARYHIPVKLDDNSTGPLLTQIEASKNNPSWGLLWVDGDEAFAELDAQHLLVRNFLPQVAWNALGMKVIPKDRSYVPTGVTLAGAMAYNAKTVPNPPTSWQQLLSAKWKGKVGTNDPTQSGPTYPFVAGMMHALGGVKQGEAYFERLKANGLVINPTNGPTLAALASGAIDIALVQSSAAVGATFTDKNIKVRYLNPVTLLPSCIGIDAKAPKAEQDEAKLFASFVLSKAGQQVMQSGDPQGDSLYYPVVAKVAPLKALPPLSGVKVQTLDPYPWGSRENAINTWFVNNIIR
jgi:iron(III) transport system substrate-binding protein